MTWGSRDSVVLRPDTILGLGVIRLKPPMAALSESSGLQDDARLTNIYIPCVPHTRTPLGLVHIFVDSIEKNFSSEDSLYDCLLASFLIVQQQSFFFI
jgi:hypothetical protein